MDSKEDTHLAFQFVGSNPSTYLHQEDDAQQEGEGEGHAVVLLDCSTTSKEGNEKDDAANNDKKHGGREESITKEIKVLAVSSLDNSTSDNEEEP